MVNAVCEELSRMCLKERNEMNSSFARGVIAYACCNSLFQDILGLDGYIQMVQDNWVSEGITVPIALFALFLVHKYEWKNHE